MTDGANDDLGIDIVDGLANRADMPISGIAFRAGDRHLAAAFRTKTHDFLVRSSALFLEQGFGGMSD